MAPVCMIGHFQDYSVIESEGRTVIVVLDDTDLDEIVNILERHFTVGAESSFNVFESDAVFVNFHINCLELACPFRCFYRVGR